MRVVPLDSGSTHVGAVDALVKAIEPLLAQSPAFAAIFEGPEHIYRLTNSANNGLIGRDDLIGKSLRDAVPEAESQGLLEKLDEVYASGTPFYGDHIALAFVRESDHLPVEHIVSFVYHPIFDHTGQTAGVFVHGVDFTDAERAKFALETLRELNETSLEFSAWKKTQANFMTQLDFEMSKLDQPMQSRLYDLRNVRSLDQVKFAVDALESEVAKLQAAIRQRIDNLQHSKAAPG